MRDSEPNRHPAGLPSRPSTSATFLYDAAGNRVQEPRTAFTVDGETTAYIGGVYEYTDTRASTSTYAGSVMRRSGYATDNGVFTVLGDHLGSTTATVQYPYRHSSWRGARWHSPLDIANPLCYHIGTRGW